MHSPITFNLILPHAIVTGCGFDLSPPEDGGERRVSGQGSKGTSFFFPGFRFISFFFTTVFSTVFLLPFLVPLRIITSR